MTKKYQIKSLKQMHKKPLEMPTKPILKEVLNYPISLPLPPVSCKFFSYPKDDKNDPDNAMAFCIC